MRYGLEGVAQSLSTSAYDRKPSYLIDGHRHVLREAGVGGVYVWNPQQLASHGYCLTFDRQLRLRRSGDARLEEEKRPED
jgi:hypothetical protein